MCDKDPKQETQTLILAEKTTLHRIEFIRVNDSLQSQYNDSAFLMSINKSEREDTSMRGIQGAWELSRTHLLGRTGGRAEHGPLCTQLPSCVWFS